MLVQWLLDCHTGETPLETRRKLWNRSPDECPGCWKPLEGGLCIQERPRSGSSLEPRPSGVSSLTLQRTKGQFFFSGLDETETEVFRAFSCRLWPTLATQNLLVCEHSGRSLLARGCLVSGVVRQDIPASGLRDSFTGKRESRPNQQWPWKCFFLVSP